MEKRKQDILIEDADADKIVTSTTGSETCMKSLDKKKIDFFN